MPCDECPFTAVYVGSVSNAGDVGIVYDESEYDVGLLPAMLSYEPPPGAAPSPPNCELLLGPEEGDVWNALALALVFTMRELVQGLPPPPKLEGMKVCEDGEDK